MTQNYIGYTLYVSDAAPATNDTTGFEALSWTKVNGLIQGPQLGVSHSMIDIPDLQTGFTIAVKGAAQGEDTSMQFRLVADDTGQGTLQTQADDDAGTLAVKLVRGTGTDQAPASGDRVIYAQGIAHGYRENQASDTSFEGFTVNFRQNDFAVVGTEPV